MAVAQLDVVYDLGNDNVRLQAMQDATRRGAGLSPEPALVGSEAWWAKIGTPALPTHTADGVIERSYWTGHGDYPEFDLRDGSGELCTWERYGDETRYVPGLTARVHYVEHPWQPTLDPRLGHTSKVVFRVEVARSDRR